MTDDLADAIARFERCIIDRDRQAAEAVLHPDYALVLVQPARAVIPRARWLEVLPDYIVHEYAVEESVLDVEADTATSLHRDRMSATVLGEDRSGTFVITDVWRRTPDGWRVWRRHSTPLSAGHMPGAQRGG